MSQAPAQHARYRVETLPQPASQVHPTPNLPNDTVSNSSITAFSMAVHWEHLLSRERNRSRNLEYWVASLETQIRRSETDFTALKSDYERLCIMVQRHSCSNKSVQPSPTSPTKDPEAKALSPSVFLPPPHSPLPSETLRSVKRKHDNVEKPCKRHAGRGLVLNIDRPVSPKTLFSPMTPAAMQFRQAEERA